MKKFEIIITVEPSQIGLDGMPVDEKVIGAEIDRIFGEVVTGEFGVCHVKVRPHKHAFIARPILKENAKCRCGIMVKELVNEQF